MPPQDPEEIEIGDVENYHSDKLHQFSHQTLVMEILRKCAENGSHEFRPGWFNEKRDRSGNMVKVYIEDTQQKFSETVATAVAIMACDFDEDARKTIPKLQKELKDIKTKLLKDQWTWWLSQNKLHQSRLETNGMGVIQGSFNFNLGWSKNYVSEKVRIFREIFQELNLLTERIHFYEEEEFTA